MSAGWSCRPKTTIRRSIRSPLASEESTRTTWMVSLSAPSSSTPAWPPSTVPASCGVRISLMPTWARTVCCWPKVRSICRWCGRPTRVCCGAALPCSGAAGLRSFVAGLRASVEGDWPALVDEAEQAPPVVEFGTLLASGRFEGARWWVSLAPYGQPEQLGIEQWIEAVDGRSFEQVGAGGARRAGRPRPLLAGPTAPGRRRPPGAQPPGLRVASLRYDVTSA